MAPVVYAFFPQMDEQEFAISTFFGIRDAHDRREMRNFEGSASGFKKGTDGLDKVGGFFLYICCNFGALLRCSSTAFAATSAGG